MKTTLLVDMESHTIIDGHFTTKKAYGGHIRLQVFRRNAEDLQALLADKMYSWSDLREACRDASTRPVIKYCEQNAFKKAHNARINDNTYNQQSINESMFAMLKDDGDEIRSRSWPCQLRELTRKCIVHNLAKAASLNSPPALILRIYSGEASPSSTSYFTRCLVKLMFCYRAIRLEQNRPILEATAKAPLPVKIEYQKSDVAAVSRSTRHQNTVVWLSCGFDRPRLSTAVNRFFTDLEHIVDEVFDRLVEQAACNT